MQLMFLFVIGIGCMTYMDGSKNDMNSWFGRADKKLEQFLFPEHLNKGTVTRPNMEDSGKRVANLIDKVLLLLVDKAAPCIFFYITARLLVQQLLKATEEVMSIIHSHGSEAFDPSKISSASLMASNITRFLPVNTSLTINEWEILTTGVVDPASIRDDIQDLGGIENVKQSSLSLCKFLLAPSNGSTVSAVKPTSVLLFGPPGCGGLFLFSYFFLEVNRY